MNGFEVVRRAIRFQKPDRLPLSFAALGYSDIADGGLCFPSGRTSNDGVGSDHFGCVWAKTDQHNMGQVKEHPLTDLAQMKSFPWPDPDNPAFYSNMEAAVARAEAEGKYVNIGIFMLIFERMHALHGFEATLADLYLEPEASAELADRLVEFYLRVMRNAASAVGASRINGLGFTDDWGTQLNSFVSPDFWREFFAPRYRKIFDLAHEFNWDIHMHSCGKINDIIEDLILIGCDALNLQQPRALGIEEIGRRYRGRVCFKSLCDIQHTLPFKDETAIREESALLLERWATPDGGFMLTDYGDGEAIGVPLARKQEMLRAFLEFDPWSRASGAAQPLKL